MSRTDRIVSRAYYRSLNWRGEEKFSALLQRVFNEIRKDKMETKKKSKEAK